MLYGGGGGVVGKLLVLTRIKLGLSISEFTRKHFFFFSSSIIEDQFSDVFRVLIFVIF